MSKSKKRRLAKKAKIAQLEQELAKAKRTGGPKSGKPNPQQGKGQPNAKKTQAKKNGFVNAPGVGKSQTRQGSTIVTKDGQISKLVMGKKPVNWNSLPECTKIALNICDPLTYKNLPGGKKMPKIGSSVPTDELTTSEKITIDWDNTTNATNMLTYNNAFCAGLRNFECASIVFYANKGSAGWNYQMYGANDSSDDVAVGLPPSTSFFRKTTPDPAPVPLVYGVPVFNFAPHGNMWFAGAVSTLPGGRFFYVPKTASMEITLQNPSLTEDQDYDVEVVKWQPESAIEFVAFVTGTLTPSESQSFIVDDEFADEPLGAYYAIFLSGETVDTAVKKSPKRPITPSRDNNNMEDVKPRPKKMKKTKTKSSNVDRNRNRVGSAIPGGLNVACNIYGTSAVFGHRALRGFDVAPATYEQTCVNGISIWFDNLGAPAFTNGGSYSRQMMATEPWLSVVKHPQDYIGYEDTDLLAAKSGVDVFLKPDDISDFKLRRSHKLMGQYVVDSFWPIDSDDDYIVILLDVQPTPNQGVAQKGVFIVTGTGEFTSNDPTREMTVSTLKSLDMYKVLDLIKNVPNVHTNGAHVKQIYDAIVKGVKDVERVVNIAKPLLEAFA